MSVLKTQGDFRISQIQKLTQFYPEPIAEAQPIKYGLSLDKTYLDPSDNKVYAYSIAQLKWDAHNECVDMNTVGERFMTNVSEEEYPAVRELMQFATDLIRAAWEDEEEGDWDYTR